VSRRVKDTARPERIADAFVDAVFRGNFAVGMGPFRPPTEMVTKT